MTSETAAFQLRDWHGRWTTVAGPVEFSFEQIETVGFGPAFSPEDFACHDASCRPPTSGGTGGSTKGVSHRPGLIPVGKELRSVLDSVTSAGGRPFVVGGSVRDALIDGRKPKDIDIEVFDLSPDDLEKALGKVGKVDAVGKSFGVLKITLGDEDFDVSVPRTDSKVGDGHKGFDVTVDHTLSIPDALSRRDLTLNSMAWDPISGMLHDPHGGQADMAAGTLRHTSAAFSEDPLRVLRAAQFAARFNMKIHPDTVALASGLAHEQGQLAKERLWGEWDKGLMKGQHPSQFVSALSDMGWDTHYLPKGQMAAAGPQMDRAAALAGKDPVVRPAVLLATLAMHSGSDPVKAAQALQGRLGAPNDVADRVKQIVREPAALPNTDDTVRSLARRLGTKATVEEWAAAADRTDVAARARSLGVNAKPLPLPINGDDLIARGIKPGKDLGQMLRRVTEAVDAGQVVTSEDALALLGL